MADEKEMQVCASETCDCPVSKDEEYCSPSCRAAGESNLAGITCECGHPSCVRVATAVS